MKINELIQELNKLPQNLEVYLWVNGSRIAVNSVDDSFIEEGLVDINGEDTHNPHGEYK